jgi:alkylation response protein AidB-like acyl-CoA dehydrogenase
MATGDIRGAFSMTEPHCGSDVAAIRSKATRTQEGWSLEGQKMWLTNGGSSSLVAVLVRTPDDAPEGASVYKSMSTFLLEKTPGFGEVAPGLTIPGKIDKMGYKGVDTTELVMTGHEVSNDALLALLAGITVDFVWKYAATTRFVWNTP